MELETPPNGLHPPNIDVAESYEIEFGIKHMPWRLRRILLGKPVGLELISKILRWFFGILGLLAMAAAVGAVVYIIINLRTILALVTAALLIGGM